jgi:hypothetical protein
LVVQPGSKASNDNLTDDDPDLPNFDAMESKIVCRMSSGCRSAGLTQGNWIVQFGILDGPVFSTPDVGPAFLVLGHKDVEGGLLAPLWLASLVLLPLVIFQGFWLDHPWWLLFSYDDFLTLCRLALKWPNEDLLKVHLGPSGF